VVVVQAAEIQILQSKELVKNFLEFWVEARQEVLHLKGEVSLV
jgi:hypothetical protein